MTFYCWTIKLNYLKNIRSKNDSLKTILSLFLVIVWLQKIPPLAVRPLIKLLVLLLDVDFRRCWRGYRVVVITRRRRAIVGFRRAIVLLGWPVWVILVYWGELLGSVFLVVGVVVIGGCLLVVDGGGLVDRLERLVGALENVLIACCLLVVCWLVNLSVVGNLVVVPGIKEWKFEWMNILFSVSLFNPFYYATILNII